jgi:hypothetical protein
MNTEILSNIDGVAEDDTTESNTIARRKANVEKLGKQLARAIDNRAKDQRLTRADVALMSDIPRRRVGQLWRTGNWTIGELFRLSETLECNASDLLKGEVNA